MHYCLILGVLNPIFHQNPRVIPELGKDRYILPPEYSAQSGRHVQRLLTGLGLIQNPEGGGENPANRGGTHLEGFH